MHLYTEPTKEKYTIRLIDLDGNPICERDERSLKEAKRTAQYLMSEEFALGNEFKHEDRTQSVEILLTEDGDRVLDEEHPAYTERRFAAKALAAQEAVAA